jgi:hypothetical protein
MRIQTVILNFFNATRGSQPAGLMPATPVKDPTAQFAEQIRKGGE